MSGGAEVRGEVAALAGEDAAAQLPACRTLGERSAPFTGCKPRHDTPVDAGGSVELSALRGELRAADGDSMSP